MKLFPFTRLLFVSRICHATGLAIAAALSFAAGIHLAAGPARAQAVRLDPAVVRSAPFIAPDLLSPSQRAALAARLTGEPIASVAVAGTVVVSALAPIVGDLRSPTVALQLSRGSWITHGGDPHLVLSASTRSEATLYFAIAADTRYLAVCDMTGSLRLVDFFFRSGGPPVLTWEGPSRAAILFPKQERAGVGKLVLEGTGTLRSCEVSRLG